MEAITRDIENTRLNFQKLNCESFKRNAKLAVIEEYLKVAHAYPRETKKNICDRINVPISTVNRYFKECGFSGFIRKKKANPKNTKNSNSEISENSIDNDIDKPTRKYKKDIKKDETGGSSDLLFKYKYPNLQSQQPSE